MHVFPFLLGHAGHDIKFIVILLRILPVSLVELGPILRILNPAEGGLADAVEGIDGERLLGGQHEARTDVGEAAGAEEIVAEVGDGDLLVAVNQRGIHGGAGDGLLVRRVVGATNDGGSGGRGASGAAEHS